MRPEACNILERVARQDDPTAVVWKGSDIPTPEQGLKILGTPLDTPTSWNVIWNTWHESNKSCWTESLWCQMFSPRGCCCCIARLPGPISRGSPTICRGEFCHDAGLWRCLSQVLQIDPTQCHPTVRETSRLFAHDPSPSPFRGSRVGPSIGRCPSIADVA